MSIENNLKRIADALEKIAANTEQRTGGNGETEAAAPDQPAAAPAQPAAAPAQPAAAPMSAEELNAALVAEYNRLGSRDPIDEVLQSFGVKAIGELEPEKYSQVVEAVKTK